MPGEIFFKEEELENEPICDIIVYRAIEVTEESVSSRRNLMKIVEKAVQRGLTSPIAGAHAFCRSSIEGAGHS